MRADDDTSVWKIGLNRALAVTIGVVWALIVSRWWWPTEARRELARGLSELVFPVLFKPHAPDAAS